MNGQMATFGFRVLLILCISVRLSGPRSSTEAVDSCPDVLLGQYTIHEDNIAAECRSLVGAGLVRRSVRVKRDWNSNRGWMNGTLNLATIQAIKDAIQLQNNSNRVRQGANVRMSCTAEVRRVVNLGYPIPKIRWLHNNRTIRMDSRRYVLDNVLEVGEVEPTDAGVYVCQTAYEHQKPRTLAVHTLVVLTDRPTIVVTAGQSLDLICNSIYSLPHLIGYWVRWLHNNTISVQYEKSLIWTNNLLHIWPVEPHHSGVWECQMMNDLGQVWSTNNLVVHVVSPWSSKPIVVINRYPSAIGVLNLLLAATLIVLTFVLIRKPRIDFIYGRGVYIYYEMRQAMREARGDDPDQFSILDVDIGESDPGFIQTDVGLLGNP